MNAPDIPDFGLQAFWKSKYDAVLKGERLIFESSEIINNEPHYFKVRLYPMIVNNKIEGISAISQDITKDKQIESALNKSKDQSRDLIHEMEQNKEKFKKLSLLKNAILESPQGIIVFALNKQYCYLDFTMSHKKTMKEIWGVDIKVGDNMLGYIKSDTDRGKFGLNPKKEKAHNFILPFLLFLKELN